MLSLEGVSIRYGSVRALTDVTLSLSGAGNIHGVIGPNGAGKSTLIDAISGRRRPNQGRILWRGRDIVDKSVAWRRRNGMSRSFQRTSIFGRLTVTQQLALVASHLGCNEISDVLDALQLNQVRSQRADSIAYGDQRRVDVALALVGNPSLLLLDEPAAGLSAEETTALFEHVAALARERGITVVIVEHDVEAVFKFCDAITVLDLGRVVITDVPKTVRADPQVISAYLGSAA
jgi:branched-chain amino acid transport system ATP-binding protein